MIIISQAMQREDDVKDKRSVSLGERTTLVVKRVRRLSYIFILCMCILAIGMASAFGDGQSDKEDWSYCKVPQALLKSKEYTFRFVQISDTQPSTSEVAWQRMEKAIDFVNSLQPDLVFFPGDVTCFGTETEYKRAKELIAKLEAPIYLVPGNHDTVVEYPGTLNESEAYRAQNLARFNEYLGKESWSVELGNFQFVGFDCTEVKYDRWPYISATRQEWLLKTFGDSSKPYKFLVAHYPSVCHKCVLSHDTPNHGRAMAPITKDHLDYTLSAAGVIGQLFGHLHMPEAGQCPDTRRLMFDSGDVVGHSCGVMYFDVYEDVLVCFWKPLEGTARPLATYNLEDVRKDVRSAFSEGSHR